ncbi:biliverdin-producing heme oxygenase [Bradyrhizobium sp.]|uniref:biliverdin-producing heme oxygenase n=1 Tax=Bradyrhizobium sp. TaxID=376 RepID=UPI0039E66EFE
MTIIELDSTRERSRARRLRAATNERHDRLDHSIMDASPFADRERYGRFVTVQYRFHREVDALYADPALEHLLPDLGGRRRLRLIEQDLSDLGIDVPAAQDPPAFVAGRKLDLPAALGWLYVAEGSNLGAAFLLKEAAKLGLSEGFGARHLAAAPEGRGLQWKTFTAALDAVPLADAEEDLAIAGANAAFARVQALIRDVLVA